MLRRQLLRLAPAALLGAEAPSRTLAAAKPRLLYFTRSAGFESAALYSKGRLAVFGDAEAFVNTKRARQTANASASGTAPSARVPASSVTKAVWIVRRPSTSHVVVQIGALSSSSERSTGCRSGPNRKRAGAGSRFRRGVSLPGRPFK